jgi:hypothetical protein
MITSPYRGGGCFIVMGAPTIRAAGLTAFIVSWPGPSVAASLVIAPGGSSTTDDATSVLRATAEKEVVDMRR